jgi:hypothetical protein
MLLSAMIKVPARRQISSIRTVEPPEPRKVTIDREYINSYEIVGATYKDFISQNPMHSLSALYAVADLDFWDGEIYANLASRKTIVIWVHTELQISDTHLVDIDIYE